MDFETWLKSFESQLERDCGMNLETACLSRDELQEFFEAGMSPEDTIDELF